jgi:type I restriction enzyme R subunit
MESINFEFLRRKQAVLADLGGFAERYVNSDPASALIKLRTFTEQLVEELYRRHSFPIPGQANLFNLLAGEDFEQTIPKVIQDKLHQIRIDGNHAAHGRTATTNNALYCLREAWDLGRWYHITYDNGTPDDCPPFRKPAREETKDRLKRERKETLVKLAAQENRLQEPIQQVKELRTQAAGVEKTAAELAKLKAATTSVNILNFDEAATWKRLVDRQLEAAGWENAPTDNRNRPAGMVREEPIPYQPTTSSTGYTDGLEKKFG